MTEQAEPDNGCHPGCPARTALAEALACLYALTRVGGSVIGHQTVNLVPPATYDRWQAALNPAAPEPAHDGGPDIAEAAADDDAHWNTKYDRP